MGLGDVAFLSGNPDEEEEEVENKEFLSSHECEFCTEGIHYVDELFLLELNIAKRFEDSPMGCELLTANDGDYMFPAHMFHLQCWEEIRSEILELTEDKPPTDSEEPMLICTTCSSMIGLEEVFCMAVFGELHISRRMPTFQAADQFTRLGAPDPVCIECIMMVVEDCFPDWEELAKYMPTYRSEEQDVD